MLNKIIASLNQAVADIPDGATIMFGGFGNAGVAEGLIQALLRHRAKNLTLIANNAGRGEAGIALLIKQDRVRKMICSFPRAKNAVVLAEHLRAGKIELELVPQGTLAERIRAGGAGIEGFYTPTGYGTDIAAGKPTMTLDGIDCVLERALKADYAFVRGHQADRWGNLTYNQAARNFNPLMAMAGRCTIAEVDDIVDLGAIAPEHVVTPGIFVQRVVKTGGTTQP